MFRSRLISLALAFALVLLACAIPAAAQDVSAGWRLLGGDSTLKKGWYVDAAVPLTELLWIAGEGGGSYTSSNEIRTVLARTVPVDRDFSIHTLAGGVRLRWPLGPIVPFGQALFGAARQSVSVEGSITVPGGTIDVDDHHSETDPIVDLGGGINFMIANNLGIRAGLGWMRFFDEGEDNTVSRFAVGAVLGF